MAETTKHKKAKPRKRTSRRASKNVPFPARGGTKSPRGLYFSTISFTTIGEGNAGPKQAVQEAVHSAEEFARVFSSGTPPALDFSKEQAVVVTLGEKPTSGFGVRITSIDSWSRQLSERNGVRKAGDTPRPALASST
jgi:hypothetical protein